MGNAHPTLTTNYATYQLEFPKYPQSWASLPTESPYLHPQNQQFDRSSNTDIIHQHQNFRGEDAGKATQKDFHILVKALTKIGNGGVVVNVGSAVVLPEVFLKTLTITRNLGYKTFNFTSINFDMLPQYRPQQNIVCRPTQPKGKGFYITGHHEIMIPLLVAAILEKLS